MYQMNPDYLDPDLSDHSITADVHLREEPDDEEEEEDEDEGGGEEEENDGESDDGYSE